MIRDSLRRNIIYRREVRLGAPRHWWRRHTVRCLLLAYGVVLLSAAELLGGMFGPGWGARESMALTQVLVLGFMLIGPIHLALSLKRDEGDAVTAGILVTPLGPQTYLRGKLFGALRPTLAVLVALWLRWIMVELTQTPALAQYMALDAPDLVILSLASGTVHFAVTAALWALGALLYATLAMRLAVAGRPLVAVLAVTVLLAIAVELALPLSVKWAYESLHPGWWDYAQSAILVGGISLIVGKYLAYRWLFDASVDRIEVR
jgi:hypothetical protein